MIVIGHKHKFDHLNLFIKGKIAVFETTGVKILTAPMYFVAPPGRKIAYIIEDMTWVNIYSSTKTNVDEIEADILDLSDVPETPPNMKMDRIADIASYHEVLQKYGITAEKMDELNQVDNVDPLPNGIYCFKIDQSQIHGKGIFATDDIYPGQIIGPARYLDRRTVLARYTNHAKDPNAEYFVSNEVMHIRAIKPIKGCKGGTLGDEITVCYDNAFKLDMENL